jgi:hypothetical protein
LTPGEDLPNVPPTTRPTHTAFRPESRQPPCQFAREAHEETTTVTQDINVLALVKGQERYIFLYDDASRAETLRVLGRYASNADLSFSWYDAAVLSQKVRQESARNTEVKRFEMPAASDLEELS